jgi:hypothetical protein
VPAPHSNLEFKPSAAKKQFKKSKISGQQILDPIHLSLKSLILGLENSFVVEHLPNICEALVSIPSTVKQTNKKNHLYSIFYLFSYAFQLKKKVALYKTFIIKPVIVAHSCCLSYSGG